VDSYPIIFLSNGLSLLTIRKTDDDDIPFDRHQNLRLRHLVLKVPSLDALDDKHIRKTEETRADGVGAS
jgi:hypothetical protein